MIKSQPKKHHLRLAGHAEREGFFYILSYGEMEASAGTRALKR